MSVRDIRYRPWEGELRPTAFRLFAIPKYALMGVWNKALAISLFAGGAVPVLGFAGYVLIVSNPTVRELLEIGHYVDFPVSSLMQRLLWMQMFFATATALVAAPRMISTELANRALPLVYSRPVSRLDYIGGKFAGLFALLSVVSWMQTIVVWTIMAILYPPEHPFHAEMATESFPALAATIVLGLMLASSLSLLALACSSATKSPRFGAVFFFVVLGAGSLFSRFIQESGWPDFPNLGIREVLYWLAINWLDNEPTNRFGTPALLAALGMWLSLAVAFMVWKLRPADVYGD